MKKYKLLKDLPGIKAGSIISSSAMGEQYYDVGEFVFREELLERNKDFFEAIEEKKTFDNIEECDNVWYIHTNGCIESANYRKNHCRSEIFLTSEEAEDEHKRREWANRKDKLIPQKGELYYTYSVAAKRIITERTYETSFDILTINQGLAFRTEQECQDAIDNNDIIRLFYTIR